MSLTIMVYQMRFDEKIMMATSPYYIRNIKINNKELIVLGKDYIKWKNWLIKEVVPYLVKKHNLIKGDFRMMRFYVLDGEITSKSKVDLFPVIKGKKEKGYILKYGRIL